MGRGRGVSIGGGGVGAGGGAALFGRGGNWFGSNEGSRRQYV